MGEREERTDDEGIEIPPNLLGAAIGVFDFVGFAAVGYFLFEDVAFGAFLGLVAGVGGALMIPYFVFREGDDRDADGVQKRGFHRGAAGMALSGAAVAIIAVRMATEDPLLGAGAGLVAAAGAYVVLSTALPRTLPAVEE